MDLNKQNMIPYLANNSYIYGERPESHYKPPEVQSKYHQEETLIASIKNPIPCYKPSDQISNSEYSSYTSALYQQDRESFPVSKPIQVQNSSHFSQSPVPRPLNSPDCQTRNTRSRVDREYLETPQNTSYSIHKTENQHLHSNPAHYPSEKLNYPIQRENLTPSHRTSSEQRNVPDRSYKENYCPDSASNASKNYNHTYLAPSDPGYYTKEDSVASCNLQREIPSYYIDKYLKDNNSRLSDYPAYRPKAPSSRCQDSTILSENNITPCRSNNTLPTQVQPLRTGAFLDDIIGKYKDRIIEKDEKSEKYSFNREAASRTSDYSYKEGPQKTRKAEENAKKVRPSRDIWIEQAKNTKEFVYDRPNLNFEKLGRSSKSLLSKMKKTGSEKKVKKRGTVRSACSSKERKSCEREIFDTMVVKLLKTHAKHCPALRKEIDSMQTSKLLAL